MNSSGVDNLRMKSASTMHGGVPNNAQALLEAWKMWLATIMDVWRDVVRMGGDPFGVIASWIKLIEHVQERAHSGEPVLFDLFSLFSEWYETISKPWSRKVEDVIGSERFLAFTEPLLETYSTSISRFRKANEAYFRTLRLPTLSDIASVAELVVNLEEKVDTIEETIECVKKQTTSGAATMTMMANLEQRLKRIEASLDRTLALLEKSIAKEEKL